MATARQCDAAIRKLAAALDRLDPEVRRARIPPRQVSLVVTDLDLAYTAKLDGDGLHDIATTTPDEAKHAQLRFTTTSDEIVEIGKRPAAFPGAWLRGRVGVHAGLKDLLELRRIL